MMPDKNQNINLNIHTDLNSIADEFDILSTSRSVQYIDDPIKYMGDFHDIFYPPKHKYIFDLIYKTARKAIQTNDMRGISLILRACRGGGKSFLVAGIEFALWYFLNADTVNAGGSEEQAKIVY